MAYEILYKYLYPLLKELLGQDYTFYKVLNLFKYITFRSAGAVVTALILSFIIGPILIRYLKKNKLGQPIRGDGPKSHSNKSGTPTMGGILILGVIIATTLFWTRLDISFVLLILFATVSFGLIGFVDDYKKLSLKDSKGLSGKKKLIWQFIASGIIVFFISQIEYYEHLSNLNQKILPLYIPFIDKPVLDLSLISFSFTIPFLNVPIYVPVIYLPFGMIVIVGSSNAVNITDGLDGLAIGLLILAGIAFAILAYLSGNTQITKYLNIAYIKQAGELTVFCAAFVGASMGFLWFNSHPAQVFMGDTGSLALGGIIGVLALMIKKELLLVIVGGVFVLETFSVIIQVLYFKWKGKRIFKMAPIHHHFELSGWHESKVIIRFWIIGAALALVALSTLKIQ